MAACQQLCSKLALIPPALTKLTYVRDDPEQSYPRAPFLHTKKCRPFPASHLRGYAIKWQSRRKYLFVRKLSGRARCIAENEQVHPKASKGCWEHDRGRGEHIALISPPHSPYTHTLSFKPTPCYGAAFSGQPDTRRVFHGHKLSAHTRVSGHGTALKQSQNQLVWGWERL